jgi:mono/diheme cytochrome c family protein
MRTAVLLFGIAACASAQDAVQHGATLFAQTCASGYCHGARGAGGNAPRLAARGFTADYIAQTVRRGVPGTAMPAFASTLGRNELAMVIAYVASLNGVAPPRTRQAEDEPEK